MMLQILRNSNVGRKTLFSSFFKVFDEKSFIYLFLLNLISNCSYSYTYHPLIAVSLMICLSASLALLEMLLFKFLNKIRPLGMLYLFLVGAIYTILILADYFCIFNFQTTFDQNKLDILRETTSKETKEFLQTYVSFGLVLGGLLSILLIHITLLFLSFITVKIKKICFFFAILSTIGFVGWGFMIFGYVRFHNGFTIPQYTSITRIAYSYLVSKQRQDDIRQLYAVCKQIPVSQYFKDKPNVIVLIGESSSVYHSGIFGYKYNTTPNLKCMEAEGSLITFDNAVAVDDHTHGVMESVFSLDSLHVNFSSTPLFPAVYKNGKYQTHCYENQYFVGGINFLSDPILSRLMFTSRNKTGYQYDEELVNTVKVSSNPSLYVIHLMGQHYVYTQRYPQQWDKFHANGYDKRRWNEKQRTLIAQYDNATLYNDFVVSSLINKFKETNSVLIYFSDHGEEVFELRDYNGHGNAALSPNLRYQIRVPLIIWMSDSYKKYHKDLYDKAVANRHVPITTDDISQAILSLGGMRTPWYKPQRDFLNSKYNKKKHRIVLNTIDYDNYISTK